jgi:hypothetical protein
VYVFHLAGGAFEIARQWKIKPTQLVVGQVGKVERTKG